MENVDRNLKSLTVTGLVVAMSGFFIACGDSSSPNAGQVAVVQPTAVQPVELKEMRHRPSDCPRGIQGEWITHNNHGVPTSRTYSFEGRTLIEQGPQDRMIFDGRVHQLPARDGMSFWYVGACRNKMVRLNFVGIGSGVGAKVVRIEAFTFTRGRRLAVNQEIDGFAAPFLQMFDRAAPPLHH